MASPPTTASCPPPRPRRPPPRPPARAALCRLPAWCRGRLPPQQPRARPHGPADLLRVRHVDEGGLHAPPGEQVPEDLPRPVVGVVCDDPGAAGGGGAAGG